jgi:hypothetical protein
MSWWSADSKQRNSPYFYFKQVALAAKVGRSFAEVVVKQSNITLSQGTFHGQKGPQKQYRRVSQGHMLLGKHKGITAQ